MLLRKFVATHELEERFGGEMREVLAVLVEQPDEEGFANDVRIAGLGLIPIERDGDRSFVNVFVDLEIANAGVDLRRTVVSASGVDDGVETGFAAAGSERQEY